MAIVNIRERLQLHFDAEASMKSEVADGIYKVTIRVPYITRPPDHVARRRRHPETADRRRRGAGPGAAARPPRRVPRALPAGDRGRGAQRPRGPRGAEPRKVDIVLLDIRMPEMDGMEAARHIAGMAEPPAIIFTTAFDAYALEAFEVNAIDYLLKPIRAERLVTALGKTAAAPPISRQALDAAANQARRHLSVHERGKIHLVPIGEVLYLRAELKYVTVRTAAREYLVEESLTSLEEEFHDLFVRIHRNCIVAREAIGGFERNAEESESGWAVVIKATGEKLPVSRRQHHVVKQFR
jgi:two-component system response regulator AlgR